MTDSFSSAEAAAAREREWLAQDSERFSKMLVDFVARVSSARIEPSPVGVLSFEARSGRFSKRSRMAFSDSGKKGWIVDTAWGADSGPAITRATVVCTDATAISGLLWRDESHQKQAVTPPEFIFKNGVPVRLPDTPYGDLDLVGFPRTFIGLYGPYQPVIEKVFVIENSLTNFLRRGELI